MKRQFYSEADIFLKKLSDKLEESLLVLQPNWDVDHLCYRVETFEKYQILKKSFHEFGRLLIESEVNGRPIATFKLQEPIPYHHGLIDIVELPAPKAGKKMREGFEHAEVVCDVPFSEIEKKAAQLQFDKSGLKKRFNKEFEVHLGEINIKFHHLSLESVVKLEGNKKAFETLQKSRVLEIFEELDPLVAGTFPLGLETKDSDIDVLLHLKSEVDFLSRAHAYFGHLPSFVVQNEIVDGLNACIVKFNFEEIPFELFAQDLEPVYQTAYRHFLVEERLLKESGRTFFQEVKKLRAQGVKTELAFAQLLKLEGDPYKALLDLQKKTI